MAFVGLVARDFEDGVVTRREHCSDRFLYKGVLALLNSYFID